MFKLTLYPFGAPTNCTCELGLDEKTGEIIEPNLNACAFTIEAHRKALDAARARLLQHPAAKRGLPAD